MAGFPLLVLLGAIGLWAYHRKTAEKPLPSMEVVPLVGLRGFQVTPAFSPDGNQVAFRDSDGAHNTGIYTTMVGGGKSLRLTSDPGDCCPAWSPDGRQIAFIRYADKTASIVIIPALGGTERHVYQRTKSDGIRTGVVARRQVSGVPRNPSRRSAALLDLAAVVG